MSQLYSRFYYVYDDHLAYYLTRKGHRFNTHARTIDTDKEFFQFNYSDQLRKDIETYTQRKLLRMKGDTNTHDQPDKSSRLYNRKR